MAKRIRRRVVAMLSGLVVTAAAGLVGGVAAVGGTMTPVIGGNPHYVLVGHAPHSRNALLPCQTTSPPTCYGPAQIRAAYGTDQLSSRLQLTGAGRTIAIVDAFSSPTITSDLQTFDEVFGLPSGTLNVIAPDGLTPFDPTSTDQVGWAGEITLDVEYAHAIAPGAAVDLVLAKSDQDADLYSAQRYVIDHDLGDVLSQSFGEAEQCMDPALQARTHQLFQRAAARHITVFASSADQGAALPTCDATSFFKAVSTPASDPLVTSVGGTILDADGANGAYHDETAWNEPDLHAASGGGYSVVYPTPQYQHGLDVPSRGVPDVAYNAAINGGVLAVWSSSGQGANLVFAFGGTSAGSPQWAGLVALADQLGQHRIGAINNALYEFAHGALDDRLFHDVTTGDNTYHGVGLTISGYPAGPGWDPVTGIGTPQANTLVPILAATGW